MLKKYYNFLMNHKSEIKNIIKGKMFSNQIIKRTIIRSKT